MLSYLESRLRLALGAAERSGRLVGEHWVR